MMPENHDELARLAAAGDAQTLDYLTTLLASDRPMSRGRASDWLATAPHQVLMPRLIAGLDSEAKVLWWRVLALRAEAGEVDWVNISEESDKVRAAIDRDVSSEDADARFFIIRALVPLTAPWALSLLEAACDDPDEEIALKAIARTQTPKTLTEVSLTRLSSIQGELQLRAAWMGWMAGEEFGVEAIKFALLQKSPWALNILEVIEGRREERWLPVLRELWMPPLRGRDQVGLRAASVAAMLGDHEAKVMLRSRSRSWSRRVRWVAELELLRLAEPEERSQKLASLLDSDFDRFTHHVQALAFSSERYLVDFIEMLPEVEARRPDACAVLLECLVQYRELESVRDAVTNSAAWARAQGSDELWLREFQEPPAPPWERAWSFSIATAT